MAQTKKEFLDALDHRTKTMHKSSVRTGRELLVQLFSDRVDEVDGEYLFRGCTAELDGQQS